MAKPPPIEYFEFTCRTEVTIAGPIMAQLTKIEGLDVSAPRLITEINTFSRNTKANKPEVSSQDFLAEWTKEHPTFKAKEAVNAFRADGRGLGTTAYHALTALVEAGVLKKLDEGMYSRADVKHLPAPKKAKKAKKAKDSQSIGKYTVSNGDFILRAMRRSHGRTNTTSLRKLFEAGGRMTSSVSPTLQALMKQKQIKRVGAAGDGQYVLLAKRSSDKPPKVKVTNGHAAEVAPTPGV